MRMKMLMRLSMAFVLAGMNATVSAATETEQVLASLQGYEWQLDRGKASRTARRQLANDA